MINIICSSRYKINRPNIRKRAEMLLINAGLNSNTSLNIIFVGKNQMKKIANEYKKEKVALPVLSFSYKEDKTHDSMLLGEVFVCYPQAVLLAAERNKQVDIMILKLIEHGVNNLIS